MAAEDSNLHKNMWKKIMKFVNRTCVEARPEKYYEKILQELDNFISFDAGHILVHNSDQDFSEFITVNIDYEVIDEYVEHFQYIDPLKNCIFDTPSALKSSLVFDHRSWRRTNYFNNFLSPNEFYYLCGVDIHYRGEILITITLIRQEESGDFSTAELLFLNRVKTSIACHIHLLRKIHPRNISNQKYINIKYRQGMEKYDFTPREKEVACLVRSGQSNLEISEDLFISVNTVKKHLQNLYKKAEVSSRQELIYRLLEN